MPPVGLGGTKPPSRPHVVPGARYRQAAGAGVGVPLGIEDDVLGGAVHGADLDAFHGGAS
ncbi:MAG: hypothetical protein AAGD06_22860 [Acidobacteriota bacterium]